VQAPSVLFYPTAQQHRWSTRCARAKLALRHDIARYLRTSTPLRSAPPSQRTKKAGITGKYGVRYGASLRKQVKKMEVSQHSKYTCVFCGKDTVKRSVVGIWNCGACHKIVAGGAYTLNTAQAAQVCIDRPPPRARVVARTSWMPQPSTWSCPHFSFLLPCIRHCRAQPVLPPSALLPNWPRCESPPGHSPQRAVRLVPLPVRPAPLPASLLLINQRCPPSSSLHRCARLSAACVTARRSKRALMMIVWPWRA
jgi:large subunit ribosomal protein L37Ae